MLINNAVVKASDTAVPTLSERVAFNCSNLSAEDIYLFEIVYAKLTQDCIKNKGQRPPVA